LLAFADNRENLGPLRGPFQRSDPRDETGRNMALTDTTVRLAKAGDIDRKLADEKGLYLPVTATGSKLWRLSIESTARKRSWRWGPIPTSR